jgi:hypothetical protein
MSTSDSSTVQLPPGVTIGPGRETSQTNPAGQVVQGMAFPITLPNQSVTTVFIPYTVLSNPQLAQSLIEQRVQQILAITG